MNKLKENKILYIILSVLIATALWLYVVTVVNTDTDDTVNNIPVSIVGMDVLESRNLMVTKQSAADMDIDLEGNRNSLVRLNRENITVTADVTGLTEPGEYELRCTVTLPNSIMSGTVSVVNRESYRVKLTVEKKISKRVEIEGEFSGSIASGYQADDFIFLPTSVEITGPSSRIETVDHARVTLSEENLDTTYSGNLPYELISADGSVVKRDRIECASETVYVVYPISMVRDVDLLVSLIPGGGATEDDVNCKITPEKIRISGEDKDVSALKEIIVGEIDLSAVGTSKNFIFPISLPAGLTNESGINQVIVSVKVEGLITKTFETGSIELINQPEGFTAEVITQSLSVALRGKADELFDISAQQIKVVADLSEVNGTEGQFRVPVEILLEDGVNVGVVGGEHYISVNISR